MSNDVKTPKTVFLLDWKFKRVDDTTITARIRVTCEATGDDVSWWPAKTRYEYFGPDALGAMCWKPMDNWIVIGDLGYDLPTPIIDRCILGRLPEMVIAGLSKRAAGEWPPGWRAAGGDPGDDLVEIDLGTFENER